jgi:high affinity Mn2+ porin
MTDFRRLVQHGAAAFLFCATLALEAPAHADEAAAQAEPQDWAIHGQATLVEQYHPAFRSAFRGPNSLDPGSRGNETTDITLYLGVRPWDGGEVWINPEIDQGFGLSGTLGVAAFPSGEAYKVGNTSPYYKLQRLFFRQTFDLGGAVETVDSDLNQLGGSQTENRVVVTLGKFAVTDVFDKNDYANDPRNLFLNWALVNLSTFDYAANAWGYTLGGAIEWYQDWWTLRAGLFDLSDVPNSARLESTLGRQFQLIGEFEERHTLWDEPGKVHLIAFLTHGRMGLFHDAIALAQATGQPADISLVRHMHARAGIGLTAQQQLADDLGFFFRAGYDDPSREPFEFIDSDAGASAGFALSGNRWNRKDDTLGIAFIVNGLSRQHETYFDLGGTGILVGDGKLPHPGTEKVLETYYTLAANEALKLTADYQFIVDPAYNRDRGPVSVLGARVHAQF